VLQSPDMQDAPASSACNSQIQRAAVLLHRAMSFRMRILGKELAAETDPAGRPLAMDQFDRLFGTARIPVLGGDLLQVAPSRLHSHIVVMSRGWFYTVHATANDGSLLSPTEIAAQLSRVRTMSKERGESPVSFGSLTGIDRDTWANIYHEINQHSEGARDLAKISSAALIVCLDDDNPRTPGEHLASALFGGRTAPQRVVNRWFDKLQLIVAPNGVSSVYMEHTPFDALTAQNMVDWMLEGEQSTNFADMITQCVSGAASAPEPEFIPLQSSMSPSLVRLSAEASKPFALDSSRMRVSCLHTHSLTH
jgi:carnitine O-acetyltransferase